MQNSTTVVDVCKDIGLTSLGGIINFFTCTIAKSIIPLLVTLAVAAFIWGVIQYFLYPDNEEKRKNGKSFLLWGIIALFVMVSIWGLVSIFSTTFGINLVIPQLSNK